MVEVSVVRITSVSAGTGRKTRIGLASGTRPSLQLARSPVLQEMPSSVCSRPSFHWASSTSLMVASMAARTAGSRRFHHCSIIHCTYLKAATTIGNNVSIGHRALVHGCTIHDNVLVGMGAIVMDHAVVEENVLIAAGAVVLENSRLEAGHIYAGVPAKKVKAISAETFKDTIERIANNYVMYAGWFKEE